MNFVNGLIFSTTLLITTSCSHLSRSNDLADLSIGMTKVEVEEVIGSPWEMSISSSGSSEIQHIYKNGYVWYDQNEKLKGFASYAGSEDFSFMVISRASGYKILESNKKKVFITFEAFTQLKSDEAKLVFLENQNSIKTFFNKMGYEIVPSIKEAEVVILTKLGISKPEKTQELNIEPGSSSTSFSSGYNGVVAHTRSTGPTISTSTTVEYHRSLEFIAKDVSIKDQGENIIWSTVVVSNGVTEDIRAMFPYLFYASTNLINKSTTHKGYQLAGYHTGVYELVGKSVPKIERSPSGLALPSKKNKCSTFSKLIGSQVCN